MGYADVVLKDSPNGYWPCGEASGTAAGDVIAGHNGALTVGTASAMGAAGIPSLPLSNKAVSFDATGHLDIANVAGLYNPTNLTVEAWVNPANNTQAPGCIISKNAAGSQEWVFNAEGGGGGTTLGLGFYMYGSPSTGANWTYADSNGNIAGFGVNVWSHVVATFDGAHARIYFNGVDVTNLHPTPEFTGSRVTGQTGPVVIGSYGSAYPFKFAGKIAHAAIYPSALSVARVMAHYLEGLRGGVVIG